MSDEQNTQPVEETVTQAAPAAEVVQEFTAAPAEQAPPAIAEPQSAVQKAIAAVAEAATPVQETTPIAEAAPAVTEQTAPITAVQTQEVAAPVVSEPAPVSPAAVIAQTAPAAPQVIPTVPSPQEDFEAYVDWIKNYGTSVQKEIVRVMENYNAAMKPGLLIKDDDGAKIQNSLFVLINGVLNTPKPEEFVSAWNTILAFYDEYSETIFGLRMINRFLHMWPGSQTAYRMLLAANNLIMLTANPKTRAGGLKQVNLDKTMSQGFTDLARQRIMEFYA